MAVGGSKVTKGMAFGGKSNAKARAPRMAERALTFAPSDFF